MMPRVSSMASLHFLGQDNQNEVHVMPLALSLAHASDASTGTSTRTKRSNNTSKQSSHHTKLKWCKWWHQRHYVIAMYITQTNMPLILPHVSHTCQLVHVHIWHIHISIHASYKPNAINSGIHIFCITGIYFWTNMHATLYMCSNVLILQPTNRCHITKHTRKTKQQTAALIYHDIATDVPTNRHLICYIYATYTYYVICRY